MILAANRCRDRSPKIYIAESLSDVGGITNPGLGDVAIEIVEGAHEIWRLEDTGDVATGFDVIESNASPCGKWVRASSVVNVKLFGATGNGETDETDAFADAIEAAAERSIIYVPIGRYVLSPLTIDKDLTFVLEPGAVLLMASDSAGTMLNFTVNQTGGIFGGTIDGQKDEQTLATWYPVVKPLTATRFVIRDVVFQNCAYAAVQDVTSTGTLEIAGCTFLNAAEHGGVTTTKTSMSLWLGPRHLFVHHCNFIQDDYPSVPGRSPGGILVATCETANICDNYFRRVGLTFMLNHVACIHFYEQNEYATICRNTIVEPLYNGIQFQNSSHGIICENQINGLEGNDSLCGVGIWASLTIREQVAGPESIIISNNIVHDLELATGIYAFASTADAGRAIIANNDIHDCLNGIRVSGWEPEGILFEGPVLISGNTINADGDFGIRIEEISGSVKITDNDVRVTGDAHGLWAITGLELCDLDLTDNYFSADLIGWYGATMRGLRTLAIHSGVFSNSAVGGGAYTINQDFEGHLIQSLMVNSDEITILAGLTIVTTADIVTWTRSVITLDIDPNNNIQAPMGARYVRTTGGASTTFYVKESAPINGWVGK